MDKESLRKEFSEKHPELYQVELFKEKGFIRKKCRRCGRYFWTLDKNREYCPNQPCSRYEFIKNPSGKKLDYVQMWDEIKNFFVENGHQYVRRYPVVARWRDDLYFTVASIIDFQRVEEGKIIFDFPANPLIVPQMSLRFNDITNVGLTGRHYTSFCMIGQHALANEKGYWKDRTIQLDFDLLTKRLGIPEEEVVFVEDVWLGYGAFGYSLEYFVKNLELGNAVFTEFEGSPSSYTRFSPPVVDMGAGLERFVWLSYGTPTSYEAVFGSILEKLRKTVPVIIEEDFASSFYETAGEMDFSEGDTLESLYSKIKIPEDKVQEIMKLKDLFILLDHSRTLLFAMSDGQLPSNVGGGYNLRVVLRRMLDILKRRKWGVTVFDMMKLHADYLKPMYPELTENIDRLKEVVDVEQQKYEKTLQTAEKMLGSYKNKKLDIGEAAKLYESNGISPEVLKEKGLIDFDPSEVYNYVAGKHINPRTESVKPAFNPQGLPKTEQLYYDRSVTEFEAKVLKVDNGYVILDRTAFYPRSGGQEPDHGELNGVKVVDVIKISEVIGHKVENVSGFKDGETVIGKIDVKRREALMRHHTATHVVNAAARAVLGPWVWQHSAFKEEGYARIDITHHSPITEEQLKSIELYANSIVQKNVRVEKLLMPRTAAESQFGFRIYQGGAVPGNTLRILKIGDYDVEACGGTHCDWTGEIGLIKITNVDRIQDGVDRIEFVAGEAAVRYVQTMYSAFQNLKKTLNAPDLNSVQNSVSEKIKETEDLKNRYEELLRKYALAIGSNEKKNLVLLEDRTIKKDDAIIIGDTVANNLGKNFMWLNCEKNGCFFFIMVPKDRSKDVQEAIKLLTEKCKGSGGAKNNVAQGFARCDEESIKNALSSLLEKDSNA
ncbi:MAG: alanine--tRNA ligase [Nitrososphaeria archaeon]